MAGSQKSKSGCVLWVGGMPLPYQSQEEGWGHAAGMCHAVLWCSMSNVKERLLHSGEKIIQCYPTVKRFLCLRFQSVLSANYWWSVGCHLVILISAWWLCTYTHSLSFMCELDVDICFLTSTHWIIICLHYIMNLVITVTAIKQLQKSLIMQVTSSNFYIHISRHMTGIVCQSRIIIYWTMYSEEIHPTDEKESSRINCISAVYTSKCLPFNFSI